MAKNRVLFSHFRKVSGGGGISPRGGVTVAGEFTSDGLLRIGVARCSENDNFNRKTGRELAINRAADNFSMPVGNIQNRRKQLDFFREIAYTIANYSL